MTAFKGVLLGFLLLGVTYAHTSRGPLLDNIIKDALEKARPQLKDLEIPDQNFNLTNGQLNITAQFCKGVAKGLDKFVLKKLSTTLVPLKVTNFTMTIEEVKIKGVYDLNGTVTIPGLPGNITVFGNGDAKIVLRDIFFTIAADFVRTGGKFQIPPKGLRGFYFSLSKSEVELCGLMGGGELGNFLNEMLSRQLPTLVQQYEPYLLEMIREAVNEFLRGKHKFPYSPEEAFHAHHDN